MEAIILVGGIGSRIRSVTDKPKCLLKIDNKPILKHIIDNLHFNGFYSIILSTGYKSNFLENFCKREYPKLNLKFISDGKKKLGTAGAIKNCENKILSSSFIVLNGDTIFNLNLKNMINYHLKKKSFITIAGNKLKTKDNDYGCLELDKMFRILSFKEKNEIIPNPYINAGIYIMNKKVLKSIQKGEKTSLEKDVFPKIISKEKCYFYDSKSSFTDLGTPERYNMLRKGLKA